MAERVPETLHKKLSDRLGFYEDLGIRLFYRDRGAVATPDSERRLEPPSTAHFSVPNMQKEETLPKPAGKPVFQKTAPIMPPCSPKIASLPTVSRPSLFHSLPTSPNTPSPP